MTTRKFTQTTLSVALLLTAAGGASAAAFQLAEVSTSGLGRAYAGEAAIGDNASVVATNPALMTRFKKPELSAGAIHVKAKVDLDGDLVIRNTPIASAKHDDIIPGATVPHLYYVHPLNDQFAVGAGMNVNFGLRSEFDENYNGGVFGGKTDLTTINLNLSGAYRISEGWSASLGFNAVYTKAKLERNAGIIADLTNRRAGRKVMNKSDHLIRLQDNAWGFGWNAGLLYEFNENNRIGVAYHSHIDIDYKDNTAYNAALRRTDTAELKLNLPAYWEISGYHKLTDKFAMHYSYKYTKWSRFQELNATYNSDSATALHKEEGFVGQSRLALGTTYDVNDTLTLRAGIAYDQSAAGQHHSASIPDTDRTWYSIGATYNFTPDLSVDIGYAHLRGSTSKFTEKQDGVPFQAKYTAKSKANLYGLSLNYRF